MAYDWRIENRNEGAELEEASSEEGSAIARIDAQKVIACFEDDPLPKDTRGHDGWCEMCRSAGIEWADPAEYETKRTKIRRRLEKVQL